MKKCPSCGMQYQDTESYCMECGKKLVKMEMSEMPPSELMSLISHVKDMENEIINLKESAIPPANIIKITSNAATIQRLKDEMTNLSKVAAAMSPDDLVSLVSQVGEIENTIDDLGEKVDALRTTKIP
ncbi:MAG: zinc ribbon domain-containing protein, partial [Candidatus Aenigmarchaeota archaeon]